MAARKKREFQEHKLSRRERQIMQVVYRLGQATVAEITATVPEPPTADSIRRMCHILEDKGHLKAHSDGNRKVYQPTVTSDNARTNALDNMLETFFAGSPHMLVATLLDAKRDQLSPDDIQRLTQLIENAEKDAEA